MQMETNVTALVPILTLAALAGGTWRLFRARAERRRRDALDRYAEREMAKGTSSRSTPDSAL
jgi:hypothetical protein